MTTAPSTEWTDARVDELIAVLTRGSRRMRIGAIASALLAIPIGIVMATKGILIEDLSRGDGKVVILVWLLPMFATIFVLAQLETRALARFSLEKLQRIAVGGALLKAKKKKMTLDERRALVRTALETPSSSCLRSSAAAEAQASHRG